MTEPCLSEQLVVASLIEEQLMVSSKRGVDFAVSVEVRRVVPAAVAVMQEQYHAFADIDEDAYVATAPVGKVSK